jgi:hypothetical protein
MKDSVSSLGIPETARTQYVLPFFFLTKQSEVEKTRRKKADGLVYLTVMQRNHDKTR